MHPLPKKRPDTISASEILHHQPRLLDVRAPVEFAKGSLPGAENQPILTDEERRQVGIIYKEQGNAAATRLGHELVGGAVREGRINEWLEFAGKHSETCVMCWRGGQRSEIAQQWLADAGAALPRVAGGYKAVRSICMQTLDAATAQSKRWIVIAGRTGTQKTVIVNELSNSIDLEGHARHRGSAFGGMGVPQPSLPSFENALAFDWLRHHQDTVVVEDESRTIGRLAVPEAWHDLMQQAPLALVTASLSTRVEHIYHEYVEDALASGASYAELEERYRGALSRIKRRLGGALYSQLDALIKAAFQHGADHRGWIEGLLKDYYDPMYDYQLSNKRERVAFEGDRHQVIEYLTS